MTMDWRSLETFSFGDHPALADELVELVLEGKKRATCWAVSEGLKGAALGKPMVALDGKNRPRVVLNLYSITTNQEAISRLFRVINRYVGNLAPITGRGSRPIRLR